MCGAIAVAHADGVALGSCVVALPFCRTQMGSPPLHAAAGAAVSHNQAAIVELLLQHGASMDTVWVRAFSTARCLLPWNAGMFFVRLLLRATPQSDGSGTCCSPSPSPCVLEQAPEGGVPTTVFNIVGPNRYADVRRILEDEVSRVWVCVCVWGGGR